MNNIFLLTTLALLLTAVSLEKVAYCSIASEIITSATGTVKEVDLRINRMSYRIMSKLKETIFKLLSPMWSQANRPDHIQISGEQSFICHCLKIRISIQNWAVKVNESM